MSPRNERKPNAQDRKRMQRMTESQKARETAHRQPMDFLNASIQKRQSKQVHRQDHKQNRGHG